MFFQRSQHWNKEDFTLYVILSWMEVLWVYWIKHWLGNLPFPQWFIIVLGVLADPGQVISTLPNFVCLLRNTELWWMLVIPPLCGEIVGKEITSSDHFHPSASAVQCLPDLLSSSGYHASCLFEASWDIPSLKKDTLGMLIIGMYCSWPTGSLTQQLYLKYSDQPAKANKIPQTKW